jgi:tetratricopeptide (TPR) repeat protein
MLSIFPLSGLAQEEVLNPGPRSEKEAALLFEEANQALSAKNYAQSIRSFQKLIARYPSFEHLQEVYLGLLDSLSAEKRDEDLIRYGDECLHLKWTEEALNRVRAHLSQAELTSKNYSNALTRSDELLKANPNPRQSALAHSIRFQSFLEQKQYREAEIELDLLIEQMKKVPIASFERLLPEFKMSFAMRQCTITHLLKNKEFTDEETLSYFNEKNLCFKGALPAPDQVTNLAVLKEWCEDFTVLHHELQKMKIDHFLKDKITQDLKATFEFSKGINIELSKCYAPLKPKKARRKRRIRKA